MAFHFIEAEIAKYERRVKKIAENPNPAYMRCNKYLYQIWLDFMKRLLREHEEGKPFVYTEGATPLRPLMALGLRPIFLEELGDRASTLVPQYFDLIRGWGFPADSCDRVQLAAAVALSKGIPPPRLVVTDQSECDSVMQAALWAGRYYRVPIFGLDVPLDRGEESLRYVARQLEELIQFVEREIPGTKFDEAKLIELQERERACEELEDEIFELTKVVPCPLSGKDSLRMPPLMLIEDPRVVDYFREFRDELKERAERGESPAGEEKTRLMWLVSAPFYWDIFSYLECQGIANPLYEEGPGVPRRWQIGDTQYYGRKLSPLEEEAARMISGHWAGPAERRVQEILDRCQRAGIKGLVHFQLTGCATCMGCAQIVAERAERELGIPSLHIEGRCQDSEGFNEKDFAEKLESFASMLM